MDPQTFEAHAGDDVDLTVTVRDSAGAAVNINGATCRFSLQRRPGQPPVSSTGESPPTITTAITDAANGIFVVTIPKAVTEGLLGTYHWQAETEDASGAVAKVAFGFITFRASSV